jgi:hypothetical protein
MASSFQILLKEQLTSLIHRQKTKYSGNASCYADINELSLSPMWLKRFGETKQLLPAMGLLLMTTAHTPLSSSSILTLTHPR